LTTNCNPPGGIGGLLSMTDSTGSYSYIYDGKGNVVAVVNSSAADVVKYRYDEFGVLAGQSGTLDQPYGFSTKRYYAGIGLSYYGYRFYAASLGRWMTRDPLGEAGGLNLYGFVGNGPMNAVDAWGLITDILINQPIGWGTSSLGHAAVNINGTVYSWEGEENQGQGVMTKYTWDAYRDWHEEQDIVGSIIKLTPEQEKAFIKFLEDYGKNYGTYNAATNNCTKPIQRFLETLDIDIGNNLFPVNLGYALEKAGIVTDYNFYEKIKHPQGVNAPWAH
jgi:RHS repeat-associated protein